jgi:hypothetical protein
MSLHLSRSRQASQPDEGALVNVRQSNSQDDRLANVDESVVSPNRSQHVADSRSMLSIPLTMVRSRQRLALRTQRRSSYVTSPTDIDDNHEL